MKWADLRQLFAWRGCRRLLEPWCTNVRIWRADGALLQLVLGRVTNECCGRRVGVVCWAWLWRGRAAQSGGTTEKRRRLRCGAREGGATAEICTGRRQTASRGAAAGCWRVSAIRDCCTGSGGRSGAHAFRPLYPDWNSICSMGEAFRFIAADDGCCAGMPQCMDRVWHSAACGRPDADDSGDHRLQLAVSL